MPDQISIMRQQQEEQRLREEAARQEALRIELNQNFTWDVPRDQDMASVRAAYSQPLIEEYRDQQANRALLELASRQLPQINAVGTSSSITTPPFQEEIPKKTYKQRREEAKKAKEARKHTPNGDAVSFDLANSLSADLAQRENSLGTLRTEINAAKTDRHIKLDMRVLYPLISGHKTDKNGNPANQEEAAKLTKDQKVIKDYCSGDLEKRKPYLQKCINNVLEFDFEKYNLGDNDLRTNAVYLERITSTITCLENMEKDPINTPFFSTLSPVVKKELNYKCNEIGQLFSASFASKLGIKGVYASGKYIQGGDGALDEYQCQAEFMRDELESKLRERPSRMADLTEECVREIYDHQKWQLLCLLKERNHEMSEDPEYAAYKDFHFTSDVRSLYSFESMLDVRALAENAPEVYRDNKELADKLFKEYYKCVDVVSGITFEAEVLSNSMLDIENYKNQMSKEVYKIFSDRYEEKSNEADAVNQTIEGLSAALSYLFNRTTTLPFREYSSVLERYGMTEAFYEIAAARSVS